METFLGLNAFCLETTESRTAIVKIKLSFWLAGLAALPCLFVVCFSAVGQEIYSIFGGMSSAAPSPEIQEETEKSDGGPILRRSKPVRMESSSLGAFCVRTCDGRYFPAPPGDWISQAQSCKNFCPATETKLFLGSSIEGASSVDGKSYTQLPNAFRYRSALISDCTCTGTSAAGLAKVSIAQDETLKAGDLIANEKGQLIASRGASSESRFKDSMASMKATGSGRSKH